MFKVKRITSYHKVNEDLDIETYECDTLEEAIERLESLKKADATRYMTIMHKHGGKFFYDNKSDRTSYHYTIGCCTVSCEITDGLTEDAEKAFYIERQLANKG